MSFVTALDEDTESPLIALAVSLGRARAYAPLTARAGPGPDGRHPKTRQAKSIFASQTSSAPTGTPCAFDRGLGVG